MAPLPPGGQSRNSRVSEPPPRLEVSNKQRNSGVVVWEKLSFFFFSSQSLAVFILKARSWSYRGEDIKIKSPLAS